MQSSCAQVQTEYCPSPPRALGSFVPISSAACFAFPMFRLVILQDKRRSAAAIWQIWNGVNRSSCYNGLILSERSNNAIYTASRDPLFSLEHFSAKWIRFAFKKCGKPKKRDDSTQVETVLGALLRSAILQSARALSGSRSSIRTDRRPQPSAPTPRNIAEILQGVDESQPPAPLAMRSELRSQAQEEPRRHLFR